MSRYTQFTPNGVGYRDSYYVSEGVIMELETNKNFTPEQIKHAKNWLRNERDIVAFTTYKETED